MQKIKAIAKNTANNLFRKTESEKSVFLIVVFLLWELLRHTVLERPLRNDLAIGISIEIALLLQVFAGRPLLRRTPL